MSSVVVERDRLPGPDGFPIRVRAHLPADARETVVLCHGFKGFMDWGFFPYLTERLNGAGLRVVCFDFSGSGMTASGEFSDQEAFAGNTFGRELRDLGAVLDESARRGWIGARYGLFGHSRGGGIGVLHAASDPRVAALVTWAAISTVRRWSDEDLARWRERGYLEVRNARTGEVLRQNSDMADEVERDAEGALDIGRAAAAVRARWLIVHGRDDETVPAMEGERLAERAHGGIARLELLDTGHTFGAAHPLRDRPAALEQAVSISVSHFAEALS